MARLTIEHDSPDDDATASTRRRSIALRLDGKAWLRVEPEAFAELGVAEGDEIDEARRAAVEQALARVRARLFVVRSLAARMQSRQRSRRSSQPATCLRRWPGRRSSVSPATATSTTRRWPAARARDAGPRLRAPARGAEARSRGLPGRRRGGARRGVRRPRRGLLAREALGRRAVADDADRRRAIAFLARRGFSARAAWKAVQEAAAERPGGV